MTNGTATTAFRRIFGNLSTTRPSPTCPAAYSISRAMSLGRSSPAAPSPSFPAAKSSSAPCSPAAAQWRPQSRSLHTTPVQAAKGDGTYSGGKTQGGKSQGGRGGRGRGKGDHQEDPRIVSLKSAMPRRVPAPLRFARNRALRHWTIHRAWLLWQRKERERHQIELERNWQGMRNACEELRTTSGPGGREEGYLYRVAMEKHAMYGHNALPIEYARPQTETPARQPWNHEWTR
ncbi:hypothetical protein F4808DRAFT_312316 [Astrocystis sublimbata]|nr:hypothetical protein F4808DRAFT_312316 [Astrocystis sublimbata]